MSIDYKELLTNILEDSEIKEFCFKNNLQEDFLINNIPVLLTQKERNDVCKKCLGKKICQQEILDMNSSLYLYNNKIDFNYKKCKYKEMLNDDYVELLFVPQKNETVHNELYMIPPRAKIIKAIKEFLDNYDQGIITKGFYLYGKFGVGKSFILQKIANMFAERKVKVLFVYYPDLVRSLKSSLSNNTLETYVEKLKKAPVLMLDDFGAETNTSFIRDEVLGPILQYRAQERLPIFISSNLSMTLLRDHFEEAKTENSAINSSRIVERISLLTDEYQLIDKNYRL